MYVSLILVFLTLGLVTLGMRLPSLMGLSSSSSKPKPRPRAIVKNQIKPCYESNKKVGTAASAVVLHVHVQLLNTDGTSIFTKTSILPSFHFIPNRFSRAPPSIS